MARPRRRRDAAAIAASAVLHLGLAAVLAVQAPRMAIPPDLAEPPQTIIPIILAPRLPEKAAIARPEPLRLHRAKSAGAPPIPPLPVAPSPASAAAGPGVVALHPAPLPEGPKAEVRRVLRASPIGCGNADAVGLNHAERVACEEQLGKGARTASLPGLGLPHEKLVALDAAAAHNEACRAYRAAPGMNLPPPLRDGLC
jgi:hypothetical protein